MILKENNAGKLCGIRENENKKTKTRKRRK